jgi:lysophospholipid acyltransferase (LPLAT)-like uncharacterized protein
MLNVTETMQWRKKTTRTVIRHLAPPLIYPFLRGLFLTIRWTEVNNEWLMSSWKAGRFMIFAFWHGRMLMSPFFYRGRGVKILISRHADGELISRVMRRFGFESVRGSTRRGGKKAFRELIRACQMGRDVAITPDGPRGPKHVVQKGVIELARQTGFPIVPFAYSTRDRFHFPSWDDLLVPRPFTMGVAIWGQPLWVDCDASAAKQETCRQDLESRLRGLTEKADFFFENQECGSPL